MNILQIGTIDNAGGAARFSWTLKEAFERAGHITSTFVAWKYSKDTNVFSIPRYPQQERLSKLIGSDIDFYKTDSILETEEFKNADVVQCHNLHGYYFKLSTLKKMAALKPVVWSLHDMWSVTPHCAHAFGGELKNGFYTCPSLDIYPQLYWNNSWYLTKRKAAIYKKSDFHLVPTSCWIESKIAPSVLGNKPRTLIYDGIDIEKFKAEDKMKAREKTRLPKDKRIILFSSASGKNDPKKGWAYVERLIADFADDERYLFVCLGGSKEDERLSTDKVKFVASVSDLLPAYLSAADCLLFPSLAETFPLTTLEAMSCGLPVVGFDVGGTKEQVLHKENGYIAGYEDLQGLRDGLMYVFGLSEPEYKALSARCIERVRNNFAIDLIAQQYIALYKSL